MALGTVWPIFAFTPFVLAAAWWLVRHDMASAHRVWQALVARNQDDLSPVEDGDGRVEVAPLADEINPLLGRVDTLFTVQRKFAADGPQAAVAASGRWGSIGTACTRREAAAIRSGRRALASDLGAVARPFANRGALRSRYLCHIGQTDGHGPLRHRVVSVGRAAGHRHRRGRKEQGSRCGRLFVVRHARFESPGQRRQVLTPGRHCGRRVRRRVWYGNDPDRGLRT